MKISILNILLVSISAIAFSQEIKKDDIIYLQNDSKNENAAKVENQLISKLND